MAEELEKKETIETIENTETTNEVVNNTEETTEDVVDVEIEKEIEKEQESIKVNDVVDVKIDEKSKKSIKADDIKVGMYLKVYQRIVEKGLKGEDKSRLQMFEGLCIARKHGSEAGATFTVRKVAKTGHIIEKIFPIFLPTLEKIEVYKRFRAIKSKLYFVRKPNARKLKAIK